MIWLRLLIRYQLLDRNKTGTCRIIIRIRHDKYRYREGHRLFRYPSFLLCIAANAPIQTDQIETTQTDKRIDDPREPCKVAEYKCHQIKAEYTDQQPVDRADDHQCQRRIVKPFPDNSSFTVTLGRGVKPHIPNWNSYSMYRHRFFIHKKVKLWSKKYIILIQNI